MRKQRPLASLLSAAALALLGSARALAQATPAPVYPPAPPPPGVVVAPGAQAQPSPLAPPAAPAPSAQDAQLRAARAQAAHERAASADATRKARAEQRRARDRALLSASAHRLGVTLGFAPGFLARELPGGKARARDWGAVRQRTVELGLAYTHDVSTWLGVRADAAFGLGVTHLDLATDRGDCCGDAHARVDPSYGLTLGAAPVFQVARIGFYAAPGLVLRMFFLPDNARTLTAETDVDEDLSVRSQTTSVTRRVSFKSPAVALGFRPAFGFRFGPERRVDVGFGGDLGLGFRNADVYMAAFLRAGYAFVSLGSR